MNVTYGVQSYAWGKVGTDSVVGKLKAASDAAFTVDEKTPYAELWIGTHPKCPSTVGGEPLSAKVPQDLPFLLKVLSIDKALSIQAHPTKPHAEQLHARDPKNYPDPNHKPELIVALTPINALACSRRPEQIAGFADAHPTLAILRTGGGDAKEECRRMMERLLSDAGADAVAQHVERLRAADEAALSHEDKWCLKLAGQFPGDSGALMVYVLNLLSLRPGEGVFLKPNEPHAYLSGDGVEIMAKSDNVVRAGLTPKFKDAPTLLGMMTYSPDAIDEMALPYDPAAASTIYRPPTTVPEFQLTMFKLGEGHSEEATHTPGSSAVLLVVKGSVEYTGAASGTAGPGAAVLLPANDAVTVRAVSKANPAGTQIEGDAVVFFAEPNAATAQKL